MAWWIWILAGLALATLEMSAPGSFFFLFFGASALVVGIAALVGLDEPLWLQLLLFSVLSVLSLVFFRRALQKRMKPGYQGAEQAREVDTMVGEMALVVSEDIPPGGLGKVELRGTVWNARNEGPDLLVPGRRCRGARVDGLTLFLV
jgi:membrane protein implicated in regulation of membrane protease activity